MGYFFIQVIEDLSDHNRIFNTGYDSDITSTLVAGFDINAKHTL